MEAESHDILGYIRFGEPGNEELFFCEVCEKAFDELDDYRIIDRFGRCFCNLKCREKYYNRD